MNYGIVMFGKECGWDYDIREMFLYTTQQYQFPQPSQPIPVPYTKPIPWKTSPYGPNIWCEINGGVKATFTKEGPLGPTGIPGPTGQVVSHSSSVDSGPFAPGTVKIGVGNEQESKH